MKKRIFYSIFLTAITTFLVGALIIIFTIYNNFSEKLKNEIIIETRLIEKSIEYNGEEFLSIIGKDSLNRITLINKDGVVLYDNIKDSKSMENHSKRPEVISANNNGNGESTRLSDTIGSKTYYYAKKLQNGNIIRVATTYQSTVGLMFTAFLWTVPIIILLILITVFVAKRLTNSIINPINDLNLDSPLKNKTYDELSPLLSRMEKQNQMINDQVKLICEKQNEFEYITDTMTEGLVIYDKKGYVIWANKSAKLLFDNKFNCGSYITLCRNSDYISSVEGALKGNTTIFNMKNNGRIYEISVSPVVDKNNDNAAILYSVDITEREQSEKMRREFTANVSHELKTPLTSIMGYAEIISENIAKNEDIPMFASKIKKQAERLLTLIEDIIELSKLDEMKIKENFSIICLKDICLKCVEDLQDKANKNNISFENDCENLNILGTYQTLYELVYNLCDNAIKYNKPCGKIKIKLKKQGAKAILTIEDTGIGI
ncbi:MAG: histidine kinase dimerization/phospho-acceptor domain-containing protein, partial [Oscillospiraceae bacterium]